ISSVSLASRIGFAIVCFQSFCLVMSTAEIARQIIADGLWERATLHLPPSTKRREGFFTGFFSPPERAARSRPVRLADDTGLPSRSVVNPSSISRPAQFFVPAQRQRASAVATRQPRRSDPAQPAPAPRWLRD